MMATKFGRMMKTSPRTGLRHAPRATLPLAASVRFFAATVTHAENAPIEQQILADHQELKDLYAQYKKSGDGKYFNQFVWELSRHSIGEEIVVYPLLDKIGGNEVSTAKMIKEHREVAAMAKTMESMTANTPEFNTAFDTLMKNLTAHVQSEESHDLQILKKLPAEERVQAGNKFMNRKKIVPTHPHPSAPTNPTLQAALGMLLAPVDKFRDAFMSFPSEAELKAAAEAGEKQHKENH